MTCRELIEFLDAYLDRSLSSPQRAAFEAHLSVCLHCRNYLDAYRKTIRLARTACSALDDELPAEVPEGLVKAILASRQQE